MIGNKSLASRKIQMNLTDIIKNLLQENGKMTLPSIRDTIWKQYPEHRSGDRDRTLTKIRNLIRVNDNFILLDTAPKSAILNESLEQNQQTDAEVLEDYEKEIGTVYILKTNTFTKECKEIIKIGFTTQDIKNRINQLYTTGTPYKFTIHKTYEVKNYIELEKALHKLLIPFQLNNSREFFTDEALKYIDDIVELHKRILDKIQ